MKAPTQKKLKDRCNVAVAVLSELLKQKLRRLGVKTLKWTSYTPFAIPVPSFNLNGLAFRIDFEINEDWDNDVICDLISNHWVITHIGSGGNLVGTHDKYGSKIYSKDELWSIFCEMTKDAVYEKNVVLSKEQSKFITNRLMEALTKVRNQRNLKMG